MTQFNRILITGAAGRLGSELRKGLAPLARHVRISEPRRDVRCATTRRGCCLRTGRL